MDEWKVGDPADWGDSVGVPDIPYMGYLDGEDEYDEDGDSVNPNSKYEHAKRLSKEAWDLRERGRYEEAYDLICEAVQNNPRYFDYHHQKAIILQLMHEYDLALEEYDEALSLRRIDLILNNKAICMMDSVDWKKHKGQLTFADVDLLDEAMNILPEGESRYDYLQLKGEVLEILGEPVKAKICYFLSNDLFVEVDEAKRQLKEMENPNETYIIITGTDHYEHFKPFYKGVILNLVREPDNEYDGDAIRVEINGRTVGYVANSPWTLIKEVKSASDIKNNKSTKAEFVFVLLEAYIIARLI